MVKHIVMWKLKETAHGVDKATNARRIKEILEPLKDKIPGIITYEVGIDFAASESSADLVLYSEFESKEALDAYIIHPEHQACVPYVGEARSDRWMVDYEA